MKQLYSTLLLLISFNLLAQNVPVANAGPDQVVMDTDANGTHLVSLNASGSTDMDNDITSFTWRDASNNLLGTGAMLELELPWGGHQITLTVEDAQGLSHTDELWVFVGDPTNGGHHRIAIRGGSLPIFANGINLAWDEYSKDIVDLDESFFTQVLDDIAAAGGNALRWWLHTNGRYSPQFGSGGEVTGIDHSTLLNMRKILDMAYERGIVISMCLFSFDLLQDQGQDMGVMKNFIEDPQIIQTYIDNALIPMLEELGDHPAVMTWEIFNEAEGMTGEYGWSSQKTDMAAIQRFVNLVAGAIQRNTSETLVSTGVWSMKALTDKEGNTNYYRDDRLIEAGGDQEGVLDFYQIHYYPEHFGNEYSPFHRPASWWGLDKPIVIGEFPVREIDGRADPHMSTAEAYQRAILYGYAGAMPWSFTGHDGGDFQDAINGMTIIRSDYENDVKIGDDDNFNHPPRLTGTIAKANIVMGSTVLVEDHVDLKDVFTDTEDGNALSYSVESNSNQSLCIIQLESSQLSIALVEGVTGKSEVLIKARDSQGASAYAEFIVNVRDPQGNLALFKEAAASSTENAGQSNERSASFATDGDPETRWSSVYQDLQSLTIDFGSVTRITRVNLFWEAAFGQVYNIQASDNGNDWTTIVQESSGDGGEDEHSFDAINTRYLRMDGITRGSPWGFSLWEFEAYNDEVVTAIENEIFTEQTRLRVFPNPVSKAITIEAALPSEATFYSLSGKPVRWGSVNGSRQFELNGLPDGIYLIKVVNQAGQGIHKIIKQ